MLITCLILWMICAQPASAAMYRCEREGEPVLYSQFNCPLQNRQEHYQPQPHNLVSVPPLSADEAAALARLEKDLQQARLATRKANASARGQWTQRASRAEKLCGQANDRLTALRDRKRQGYNATEARKFDAEIERLKIQKKANC